MARTKRSPDRKYNLDMLHGKGNVPLEEYAEKHSGNKRKYLKKKKIKERRRAKHKDKARLKKELDDHCSCDIICHGSCHYTNEQGVFRCGCSR